MFLVVRCNIRNSTYRNRKIYQIHVPPADLHTQMVVYLILNSLFSYNYNSSVHNRIDSQPLILASCEFKINRDQENDVIFCERVRDMDLCDILITLFLMAGCHDVNAVFHIFLVLCNMLLGYDRKSPLFLSGNLYFLIRLHLLISTVIFIFRGGEPTSRPRANNG